MMSNANSAVLSRFEGNREDDKERTDQTENSNDFGSAPDHDDCHAGARACQEEGGVYSTLACNKVTVTPIDRAMKHDKFLYVLIALFLMIGGALVTKPLWLPQTEEAKPVAMEEKAPVATDDKEKVNGTSTARASDADGQTPRRPPADESSGGRDLTPICEKELRRTADLLRFFANRIQMGEEIKSVVADMRQQEKRISDVCHD